LEDNCHSVFQRQQDLEKLIPNKAAELQELGIKVKAMEGKPHLARQHGAQEKEMNGLSAEVRALRREQSENSVLYEGLMQELTNAKAGLKDDPHAHLKHMAIPDNPSLVLRFNRAAETWAAVSLSLLLFIIAALIFFTPRYSWIGLAIILIFFFVMESILRGAFTETVSKITLLLAMVATVILFIHFWKWIIVGTLVAMGISLMYQRLRELT